MWPEICQELNILKRKCERGSVTFDDLKVILSNLPFRSDERSIKLGIHSKLWRMQQRYGTTRKIPQ